MGKYLLEERALVSVYDPQVKEDEMWKEFDYTLGINETTVPDLKRYIFRVPDVYESCKNCHAIAVMTEWDMFKELDYQRIYDSMVKPAFIFDGRNILDHDALRKIGFEVHAI